ncbi:hypothetical protein MKW92_052720 [Papaver armeniacum]|nr:hypothetical protein MKW92_052720 [Papaver armeniacum]
MSSAVVHSSGQTVQVPGILGLKEFQLKNGIGPWMARVRIVRMWHELDFMRTNDVTSLDLLLLDDADDLMHAIVRKKYIWKFEPLLEEGMLLGLTNLTFAAEKKMFRPAHNDYRAYFNWNTDVTPLEPTAPAIPRHKFFFTEFEAIAADSDNTYLTDVVGVLTSHTNLQQLKRSSGDTCFMRELTLESISGMKLKVTLWGDSTSELTRNLETHEMNSKPIVAVVAGAYVKQYLGHASLSSTNATKIFFDLDISEVLHVRERSSHRTPPREITLPTKAGYNQANQSVADTKKTISELQETKWESGYNVLNKKTCSATAIGISAESGWYYLGCHNCTTKLVGNIGDHWCPRCKVQIDEPVPRYHLRLEVGDPTGTAFFVAMDNEVEGFAMVEAAFEPLIGVVKDYLITVNPYNMKYRDSPSFTVSKLPFPTTAPAPPRTANTTNNIHTEAANVTDDDPPSKKPRMSELPKGSSASTIAKD